MLPLTPRSHVVSSVGPDGVEPSIPCAHGTWGAAPLHPAMYSVTRVGFEPNLSGLKDRQPHQKSNGPCCARTGCAEWVRRRSNPRLRIFSPPLSHLSYRPMIGRTSQPTKKARCRGDTGLWRWSPNMAKVSQAQILGGQRDMPLIQVATRIGTAPGTQAFAYET